MNRYRATADTRQPYSNLRKPKASDNEEGRVGRKENEEGRAGRKEKEEGSPEYKGRR